MDLPDELVARPLVPADAAAVTAVMAAQELEDVGEVVIEEADIVGDWQRPSFSVSDSTIGVFHGDRLVGYAEVNGEDRGDAAVHPDYRGQGIGTELALWMQDLARSRGSSVIGMPVPTGSPGEALLLELGYFKRWDSWVLAIPEGKAIEEQPLPEGYRIRTADRAEGRAVWTVVEDAFLEWSVREREPYEDFEANVFDRPGFEPWNVRVVTDPSGEIVGAAHVTLNEGCAYVARLAVRKDQRHRGLARALLVDAFGTAREHGAHRSELSTDSRTGALSLYEKVGMEVTGHWVHLATHL
jgi:GNAT superfamily N-acetyltransferase